MIQQLIPLVGSLLLLCLVLDGIAMMVGQRDFPVTRALFRLLGELVKIAVRIVGGALTAVGNAISGAAGGGGGGRGGGRR